MNKKSNPALQEPDAANAMLRELVDGALKVFQNAVDLNEEASILRVAGGPEDIEFEDEDDAE